MLRIFTIATILALASASAQARTTIVRFDDLDVSNPGTNLVLADRIHQAATTACAVDKPNSGPITMFYRTVEKDCVSYVSKRALTKIQVLAGAQQLARQNRGQVLLAAGR